MRFLYIVGVPGAGKTTVLRKLVRGATSGTQQRVPYVYYTEYAPGVVQLGWDRETFGGTDSLGMAAQPHVLAWLEQAKPKYVLAEGDRLANAKFFDAVREMGYELEIVCLDLPPAVAEKRRAKRNKAIGKAQNEQWLKTRLTKVENLVQSQGIRRIDADRPVNDVAKDLMDQPVIKKIRKVTKPT